MIVAWLHRCFRRLGEVWSGGGEGSSASRHLAYDWDLRTGYSAAVKYLPALGICIFMNEKSGGERPVTPSDGATNAEFNQPMPFRCFASANDVIKAPMGITNVYPFFLLGDFVILFENAFVMP